ncbi:MAG TPA: hypothetical protein VEY08_03055 [Chloroflexia bacterium]|nr:hypothetical protein [Chloroflexia bacterium]
MLFTPAYIFTILLGIWVLSLVGCIMLGIACYRLLSERKRLRARLSQLDALPPSAQRENAARSAARLDPSLPILPPAPDREPDTEAPSRK